MNNTIPSKIVREIISQILIERSNRLMSDCKKIGKDELLAVGGTSDYYGEIGTTSCGTRMMADDIISGEITLEEAVQEILTPEERKQAKTMCQNWLNEMQKSEIEK